MIGFLISSPSVTGVRCKKTSFVRCLAAKSTKFPGELEAAMALLVDPKSETGPRFVSKSVKGIFRLNISCSVNAAKTTLCGSARDNEGA